VEGHRDVVRIARAALLLVLFFGPLLAYIGFGALWLGERHWLTYATMLSMASYIVFAILAERWTRSRRRLLPPIDWDVPATFTPHDRKAWDLVQQVAEHGDTISIDALTTADIYIETGRKLARRLAAHYNPLSHDPIEHVPVAELLTALELAAEDLNRLCRQVPGGDLITPAHWRRAVQAAGYLNWANDVYTMLLPIFQPWTGVSRWITQQWMVKPAWRNMQQNLLRWFFRAYVNRLGTHLIELYSGRLVIGADQYRRLKQRGAAPAATAALELGPLIIAVAGARDAGKTRLIAALEQAQAGDLGPVRARLEAAGLDEALAHRLRDAHLIEIPGYTATPGAETARDRLTRRAAVEEAAKASLLVLVVDGTRDDTTRDIEFAQAWLRWFDDHPGLETPPALVVLTKVDRTDGGGAWNPPYDWSRGRSPRELAVRTRIETLRAALPNALREIVAVGLPDDRPYGVAEELLPALAMLLHRAERIALLQYFHRAASRSKARRLISQVGHQGRRLWKSLMDRHRPRVK
jgi:predicted GTPase